MVTRKPVGMPLHVASNSRSTTSSKADPPYPTTPPLTAAKTTADADGHDVFASDLSTSPAFDLIDMREAKERARSDSDASSHGTWASDGDEEDEEEVERPEDSTNPEHGFSRGPSDGSAAEELPAALRPGPTNGLNRYVPPAVGPSTDGTGEPLGGNPWADQSGVNISPNRVQVTTNNPYLRRGDSATANSQAAWRASPTHAQSPQPPTAAPPPPPSDAPPAPPQEPPFSHDIGRVTRDEQRSASWETAEHFSVPQIGQPPLRPVAETDSNQLQQPQRPGSSWWEMPNERQTEQPLTPVELPSNPPRNLPAKAPLAQATTASVEAVAVRPGSLIARKEAPQQHSQQRPPPLGLPATSENMINEATPSSPQTPQTRMRRQKNEHYQIKHVNWHDASTTRPGIRRSPILTQNANGPCPLLALVNALILSTPADLDTALVETLRTREQVSLGLLLDAVFDELMSGRRGDSAHELPDVGELYSFLLALHTGMNVNPRFVTPASQAGGMSNGVVQPSSPHSAQSAAGSFEQTREMRLYSTFNVPLIHGWIASSNTPPYEAFLRSAPTFEDAQNIQFAEIELTDKLAAEGLSHQEQQSLEDIQTIKAFLSAWPTQLTDHGLEAISQSLPPGQIAILFRNDHFSTIYKETRHGALMTLVTDAGYGTHDEIVWESLVDVNGSASELFSGDFRVVSHSLDANINQDNSGGGEDGWQTVQSRNRNRGDRTANDAGHEFELPPPLPGPRPALAQRSAAEGVADGALSDFASSSHTDAQLRAAEQEDHDLALALQLQEEEEDRQRQDDDRRRREQQLSEQFLSNEVEVTRPPIPPRRSNRTTSIPVRGRPAVTRPADNDDPEAPPSYEQAASDRIYRPAGATPAAPLGQGNPLGAYDALMRQQSHLAQSSQSTLNSTAGAGPPGYGSPHARRRSEGNRIQRRSSQFGSQAAAYGYPGPGPVGVAQQGQPQQQQRINQATGLRDSDERCVVM